MKKIIIIITLIVISIAFLVWLFIESSKPPPGTKIADLGRGHVQMGTVVDYNSNPPTSGKHYGDWIRAGIYDEAKDDRNLVHSLEHGYVIMSYNCEKKVTQSVILNLFQDPYRFRIKSGMTVKEAYAHGIEEEASQSAQESSPSAALPKVFKSEDCHKLVDQLISIYEKKGKTRLIIIPRPNLDARIAITAWNYLDKFDQFDSLRIEKFIDAHLNMGPERTMETEGK